MSQNQYLCQGVLNIRYDFEIKNGLGNVQGSVSLVVEEDIPTHQHTQATDMIEKTNNLESNPIAEEKFREYVAGLHLLNNKAFEIQYKVICYCYSLIDRRVGPLHDWKTHTCIIKS